jgi:hypothetical protein
MIHGCNGCHVGEADPRLKLGLTERDLIHECAKQIRHCPATWANQIGLLNPPEG